MVFGIETPLIAVIAVDLKLEQLPLTWLVNRRQEELVANVWNYYDHNLCSNTNT